MKCSPVVEDLECDKTEVASIKASEETFEVTIDLTQYHVLVGTPENDEDTGVIGYVALPLTSCSKDEYNRAMAVYGGVEVQGNLPHVSICGWTLVNPYTRKDIGMMNGAKLSSFPGFVGEQ